MLSEIALVESISLRKEKLAIIDNGKAIAKMHVAKAHSLFQALWRGEVWATTAEIAEYYEVSERVVRDNFERHKEEFELANAKTFKGKDLQELKRTIRLSSNAPHLTLFSPRAGLLLGMLLRDSLVAKAVRVALLDLAEAVATVAIQPEISTDSIEIATLEAIGKTAEAIARLHKAEMAKLNNIENLLQANTVDVKGEIRHAADSVENKIKETGASLIEELSEIKRNLEEIRSSSGKKRQHYVLSVHLTPEEHAKIVAVIDSLNMSRNQFLYTLIKPYLEA